MKYIVFLNGCSNRVEAANERDALKQVVEKSCYNCEKQVFDFNYNISVYTHTTLIKIMAQIDVILSVHAENDLSDLI